MKVSALVLHTCWINSFVLKGTPLNDKNNPDYHYMCVEPYRNALYSYFSTLNSCWRSVFQSFFHNGLLIAWKLVVLLKWREGQVEIKQQ